tara:strand:+ start:2062 stop:2211 length:150 start_codon:yes stop_codon:yes gene_type:complete
MNDLQQKQLENLAKELGTRVEFMNCYDMNSEWKKIVIEYDHVLREKDAV